MQAGTIAFIILALCLFLIKNRELKAVFLICILLVTASSSFFSMKNSALVKDTRSKMGDYSFAIYDVKENVRNVTLKGKLFLEDGRSLSDMSIYLVPQGKYVPGDIINISGTPDFAKGENIALSPKLSGASVTSKGKAVYKPYYYAGKMRKALNEASLTITNKEISNLFPSLLTGSKNYLTRDLKRSLYDGGIAHIAAVSGLHLSVIISFVFFLFPMGRKIKLITAFFLCIFVAGISAFSPSVLRAAVMVLIFLSSGIFKRSSDGITSLGLFIFLAAVISPRLLFSLSTWFSCLSVFGILSLAPYFSEKLSFLCEVPVAGFLIKGLIVSFSATILTLPASLYFFGSFSVLSIFLNVLVVPLVSFALPLLWAEVMFILIFGFHIPLLDMSITKICEIIVSMSDFIADKNMLMLCGYKLYLPLLLSLFAVSLSVLALRRRNLRGFFLLVLIFISSGLLCDKLYTELNSEDIFAFYPEDMSCAVIKNGESAVLIGNLTDSFTSESLRSAMRKYGVRGVEALLCDYDESAFGVLIDFLQSFDSEDLILEAGLADTENHPPHRFIEKAGGECTYSKDEISFSIGGFTILKTEKKCDIINNYRITESRKINISRLLSGVNYDFRGKGL